MTLNIWAQELIAFVFFFLYGSFFEWAFHKHLFHSPKFIKATFKAHQLVHHQRYKFAINQYEWQEGQEKDHIAMDWFALPLFLGVHLPMFVVIKYLTGWHCVWGGMAAIAFYYAVYEYFHFCMHVPAGRTFEKLRPFTFAKEHHRIHHKYMLQNLNVFFPLADKCLGTYRSAASMNTVETPGVTETQGTTVTPPAAAQTVAARPLVNRSPAEAFSDK